MGARHPDWGQHGAEGKARLVRAGGGRDLKSIFQAETSRLFR
jgi:hypothetical protein